MNYTENNKLIAEFMGGVLIDKLYPNVFRYQFPEKETLILPRDLKYHTDWNWLMEVVDNCSKLDEINGLDSKLKIEIWMFLTNDIGAVYTACVEFIKWYNLNK